MQGLTTVQGAGPKGLSCSSRDGPSTSTCDSPHLPRAWETLRHPAAIPLHSLYALQLMPEQRRAKESQQKQAIFLFSLISFLPTYRGRKEGGGEREEEGGGKGEVGSVEQKHTSHPFPLTWVLSNHNFKYWCLIDLLMTNKYFYQT